MSFERKKTEKIASAAAIAIAAVQVILSILQILDVIGSIHLISATLSCIMLLLLAYVLWPKQRTSAIVVIACAFLSFCLVAVGAVLHILDV